MCITFDGQGAVGGAVTRGSHRKSARFARCSERWTPEDGVALAGTLSSFLSECARVLDVGGGTGRLAASLAQASGCDVTVLDSDPEAVRAASGQRGVTAVVGEASALPFPDAVFDAAIIVDALHHMDEPRAAATEVVRVLRLGGVLYVAEPDPRVWRVRLDLLLERMQGEPATALRPEALAQLFSDAGLEGECSVIPGGSCHYLGVRR